MSPESVSFPWGNTAIDITLPESWSLSGVFAPSPLPGVPNPAQEMERSLGAPIRSKHLHELAKPGMRVALVVDDASRPTPVALILPPILAELQKAGVHLSDVSVIAALGVHRPMTDDELSERIGKRIASKLRWVTHDCDNLEKLSNLGTSSRGTPILINKTVAEADLVISIGCIEPHVIASFGGGYKNIIPGVAGRATIAHNHTLNCRPGTFNMVGQPIENNPMRLDLEEGCQYLKPPLFIVNAVINSALEVVRVVCGDPIAAHRDGVKISTQIYGAKVPAMADVVITASHPMDQDLRQGVKALSNTIRAVRPGGVMINLIRAEEGTGVFGLANRKLPIGRNALKILAPMLLPLVPKLKLKGMGEEDRFFLYFALQAMQRCKLLLYAPNIPSEIHERLPFVQFVASVEEALDIARQRFPVSASVMAFPHGGMTYPILP